MEITNLLDTIIQGDALTILKTLPNETINCVVTSPPYWGLRDYGVEGQLGLEKTFEEYISKLCDIFDEVKRVLRKDGTCWVNMGDSYGGFQGKNAGYPDNKTKAKVPQQLKPKQYAKCLLDIPYRFSIEMINRGWIKRNTLIWWKPNVIPSSAKDRFTVDFEYVYFFVKNEKYWFEQQFEDLKSGNWNSMPPIGGVKKAGGDNSTYSGNTPPSNLNGRNKRCVWTIPTQPFPEAHFATYPEKLIIPMIEAGCPRYVCKKCGKARIKIIDNTERVNTRPGNNVCNKKSGKDIDPNKELHKSDLSKYRQQIKYKELGYSDCGCNAGFEGGIVLDPFMGAGTTAIVAKKLGRKYLGIELNPKYIEIANKRLNFEMLNL